MLEIINNTPPVPLQRGETQYFIKRGDKNETQNNSLQSAVKRKSPSLTQQQHLY